MPEINTDLPPVDQKYQDELLHTLARCGFIGNDTHTADRFTPVNPPNLPRCFAEVRELVLRVEREVGGPEEAATADLERAARAGDTK
jgi:hypothetical protein